MNEKGEPALLKLPFDQFQRYSLLAELVKILDQENTMRILEVGGAPVKLPEFLPERDTIVTDQLECAHPIYVCADAIELPFQDSSFDIVASMDTLEHIVPESRENFLAELARVSSKFIVLAAPFKSSMTSQAEKIVFDFIKAHIGYEHMYFKEHKAYGLPDPVDTESYFISRNFHTLILPNGRLDRWLLMMIVYYYLEGDEAYVDLNQEVSAFYNRHYYPSDNKEPSYRHFIVASRETFGDKGDKILALAAREPGHAPDFDPVKALIELARLDQDKVLKQGIKELEAQLRSREREISGLRQQVERLEDFSRRTRATPFYKIYARFFKRSKT